MLLLQLVQLILDRQIKFRAETPYYSGVARLEKDFELLVGQRSEETLKLKRIILRILAARAELAHMSSESSQAEAGVKIKAKDKGGSRTLKTEVEKAKKSLALQHDKGVQKLELDIIKKIIALVHKSKVAKPFKPP